MAQQLKALPCKSEDQSSNLQNPQKMWATCNSNALSPGTAPRARCLVRQAVLAALSSTEGRHLGEYGRGPIEQDSQLPRDRRQ